MMATTEIIYESVIEGLWMLLFLSAFYIVALLCEEKKVVSKDFHTAKFSEMKKETWKWGNK